MREVTIFERARALRSLTRIRGRRGAVLVWFALLFVLLLSAAGLVIDVGLLLAARRQAQNAADAAATAAATDLLFGKSSTTAKATAVRFVKTYNGIPAAAPDPTVNIPPQSGDYSGANGYAEVIVHYPVRTFLIHLLPGISPETMVRARAVGGFEPVAAGAGVAVLNPFVTGLNVSGTSTLWVEGLVVVNSQGKGVDADGLPVGTGENYYAARAGNNSPAYAERFHIVGGVDWPQNFRYIDPQNPQKVLYCGQLPVPDPLAGLPTPTVSLGVDPTERGYAHASNKGYNLYDPSKTNRLLSPDSSEFDPALFNGQPYLLLHPGIYTWLWIEGGNVKLKPGIYVIRPQSSGQGTTNGLKVTGGSVIARGIMFYNTGNNYDPYTGLPDCLDGEKRPPQWGSVDWDDPTLSEIQINASMKFHPIDLTNEEIAAEYDPAHRPDGVFDGMLFYQRRRNTKTLTITGNAAEGNLTGTLYAKWAPVSITGQGTYDAQFVVGCIQISGGGFVSIEYVGKKIGKAPQVFLVE